MRSVKISLALASLSAFVGLASCTLITDVDRSKIPTDDAGATPGEGGDSSVGGGSEAAGAGGSGGNSDLGGAGADAEAGVAGVTP
jgi:hypothetical protein